MNDRLPRKLAAILYTDVAGYSRLTSEDEDATHRILTDYLDLISATIESHGGQVMHYAGDAVLARFDAVVDAVSCATEIQDKLRERNQELPNGRKVHFRIGVNSGDVIEDRGDIYGDGVNVAARLESLADPGGICISDAVRSAIGKKLDLEYEDMGEQQVKNIADPVRAYKLLDGADDPGEEQAATSTDNASIAVLPFTNMSGDPEQDYFSDGITEDIITALSCIPGLLVVARNSSMVYKGKAVDVKAIGKKLGVRYVLEGSVRKGGKRVRVTAQLIDAESGHHLWADRYDRDLDDIFAVQDEITHKIMVEMRVSLSLGEKARMLARRTNRVEAWELQLKADELNNRFVREYNQEARRLAEKALGIDPGYVSAWTELGWTHCMDVICGWSESVDDSIRLSQQSVDKALELESDYPLALSLMSYIHMLQGDYERSLESAEKAVMLAPNNSECVAELGHMLLYAGSTGEATELIEKAIRLTPMETMWHFSILGLSYLVGGEPERSIKALREAVSLEPESSFPRIYLVSALVEANRESEAKQVAAEVSRIDRNFSLSNWRGLLFRDATIRERLSANLIQAGLAE